MNDSLPKAEITGLGEVLEENAIGALWQICFVANSFVFPIYAQFDKEYEISRMEFVVLFVLSHRDSLMAWEICRMTALPKNNISRGIQKLETKGLIARTPDPKDARRAMITTTQKGHTLFGELLAAYTKRADGLLSLLDENDKSDLDRIMVKLSKSMPTIA